MTAPGDAPSARARARSVSDVTPARERLLGYGQALLAAALWGSSGVFAVNLFRLGLPPASVALLRPFLGVLMIVAWVAARRPSALVVDPRGLLVLAGAGGLAIGIFQIAYQLSTDAVGVPSTVAMLYLAPALVAAGSGPLLGEWPDRTRIVLLAVTLLGVWLSVLGAEEVTALFGSAGIGWGVLAGISYGSYTLFGRYASPRYGTVRTVVYSSIGSCVFVALAVPMTGGSFELPSSPQSWAVLGVFALLTIAAANLLFFDALSHIDASRVSISSSVEPVVAAVLATLVLGQGLRPIGWMGITLVVLGVAGVGVTAVRGGSAAAPQL